MSKDIYNPCSSRLIEGMLDPLVGHLKNFLSESFFIENERWLGKTGNIFAIIAAFAFLVIGLRFAIKEDSFNMFLMGIGVFLGVILVQYVAIKFVTPTLTGIQNAQTAISDNSVLSTIALLIFLSGLAALIGGIYMAIESDEFQLFLMGIGIFFSTLYASCLYLNPSLITPVRLQNWTRRIRLESAFYLAG
jgi:hypothetical protein